MGGYWSRVYVPIPRQISGVEARTGGIIDVNGAWQTLQRRSKKTGRLAGKAKTTINVKADPLLIDPNARNAVALYAAVCSDEVGRQINAINRRVAPETLERRQRYRRDGKSRSYARRYANTSIRGKSGFTADFTRFDTARGGRGGRGVGHLPPVVSDRWGKDSGRLTHVSVRVRERSDGTAAATINVPANRLDPLLFGDHAGMTFSQFRDILRQEAPILAGNLTADPQTAAKIRDVLVRVAESAVATSEREMQRLIRARRQAIADLLSTATGVNLGGAGRALGLF